MHETCQVFGNLAGLAHVKGIPGVVVTAAVAEVEQKIEDR